MSDLTFTTGRDWWLERTTPKGKQRYPDSIKVGEMGKERAYVPERTCHDTDHMGDAIQCSECGDVTRDTLYKVVLDNEGYWTVRGRRPVFCAHCGAKVINNA